MKTEIAAFCQEYDTVLSPLAEALKTTSNCIESESRVDMLRTTQAGLLDVGMRLKSLGDKIEGQQAYLLIFGPLKSGKSTLMNAISGTYVSEVTSLPAYPSLVYVSHGEKSFTMTSYDGKERSYHDNSALQEAVTRGHSELAERIREKEQLGQSFDPGVDFPEAIRRIDIRLPISDLVESSTVMVDTPGLYSRMKFGYDLMTREFRNSAACAVFVVKTDNLYLEQVFAEFTDLLDLFSRIFLVVNIDGGKRDLHPDGTLQPSLESQDPQKIIEAFETLAMNAQLKDALDDGRLRIYPIDLLNSASAYLQQTAAGLRDGESEEIATEEEGESDPEDETFQTFRQDLTEYLNSNEYFLGFMRDSLRQGGTLCDELQKHSSPESLDEFSSTSSELEQQALAAEAKIQAALEYEQTDNTHVFQREQQECETKARQVAESLRGETASKLERMVERWSESGDSLRCLLDNYCGPILNEFASHVNAETVSQVKTLVDTPLCGAKFSIETVAAIDSLAISLPELGQSIGAKQAASSNSEEGRLSIEVNAIPVRKSLVDWILFRNQEAVRQRVLGTVGDLDQQIPPDVKSKRLGEEGLRTIRSLCLESLNQQFAGIPQSSSDRAVGEFASGFIQELDKRVRAEKNSLEEELKNLHVRMSSDKLILDALAKLRETVDGIQERIGGLTETFQCDDADEQEAVSDSLTQSEQQCDNADDRDVPEVEKTSASLPKHAESVHVVGSAI
ncbi:MAG: GTPase SAR1 family protein [Verrucomicrobiales bacterium]|jgi:GTPase SAR1 family protein